MATNLSAGQNRQLSRLAKHGQPVHQTKCGVELGNGEFWGPGRDLIALHQAGLLSAEYVDRGPSRIREYCVNEKGMAYLESLDDEASKA